MVDLAFPTSSSPGPKPQEGGGRLVNAYVEKAPTGAPSQMIWRRSPGLRQLTETLNHSHTRGFLDCGDPLLWILDTRVYSVTVTAGVFVATDRGALAGTGPVTTARNNAATPDNVVVTDSGAFNLFTGSAPTPFADIDLPQPNSVAVFDGFFMFTIGDGRIFASQLNSVSVASNSFTTEQGLLLRRGITFAGRYFAMGDKWTGVYRDIGASPFPLEREVTIPRGIVGTHAVAGWEPGWANVPIWAADDYIVYRLDGYTPTPLSTDDVSRDIEAAAVIGDGSLLEASVYMHGKNAFWTLTYPDNWTWEYNLTTGEWNERESYQTDDWRGRRSVRSFNRWIIGDRSTGKLFEATRDYIREASDPLIWEAESGIAAKFPSRLAIPRLDLHMTAGVGSPASTLEPKVQISWSTDGGASYGNPVTRALGGAGETESHPYVLRLGMTKGQGIRVRLRVSDDVHVGLSGAVLPGITERAA